MTIAIPSVSYRTPITSTGLNTAFTTMGNEINRIGPLVDVTSANAPNGLVKRDANGLINNNSSLLQPTGTQNGIGIAPQAGYTGAPIAIAIAGGASALYMNNAGAVAFGFTVRADAGVYSSGGFHGPADSALAVAAGAVGTAGLADYAVVGGTGAGSKLALNTVAEANIAEGSVTQTATPGMTLTVAPVTTYDGNGAQINYAGGVSPTFITPGGTNSQWALLVLTATGALSITYGVASTTPQKPNRPGTTIPLRYIFMRPNTTAIYVADQGTAGTGYTARARDLLGASGAYAGGGGGGGGGTVTYPIAISQGGTEAPDAVTARANLGAAANGYNGDITNLAALTGIFAGGQYFGNGATGFNVVPNGSARLQVGHSGSDKQVIGVQSYTGAAAVGGYAAVRTTVAYQGTSGLASPYAVGVIANDIGITIGLQSGPAIAVTGSVLGVQSYLSPQNVADGRSEYAPYLAGLVFHNNDFTLGNVAAYDHWVSMTNNPTSGGFYVGYNGVYAGTAIPYNATAAFLSTQINTLAGVTAAGGAVVTGPTGGPWLVQMLVNTAAVNASNINLAGAGATPAVNVNAGFGNATAGRGWTFDGKIHGAIGQRQSALSGVHSFINNNYNGSPAGQFTTPTANDSYDPGVGIVAGNHTDNPSGAFWAVTGWQSGSSPDDPYHQYAQTYPIDVGIGVVGTSGVANPGAGRGFTVAFQAGGRGSNWTIPSSRIGVGVWVQDHDTYGLRIGPKHAAAIANLAAIAVSVNGGGVLIGDTATALGTPATTTYGLEVLSSTRTANLTIGTAATGGAPIILHVSGASALAFGTTSTAAGGSATTAVTGLSGLAVGDIAWAASQTQLTNGCFLVAQVVNAGQINISWVNNSGASLPAPGNITVRWAVDRH